MSKAVFPLIPFKMPIDLKTHQDAVIVKELFQGGGRKQEQDRKLLDFQNKIVLAKQL